jgi:hypothetical protein
MNTNKQTQRQKIGATATSTTTISLLFYCLEGYKWESTAIPMDRKLRKDKNTKNCNLFIELRSQSKN